MFLTTPSRIWPSARVASSSLRCSARLSSRTARRLTTMLPRRRSILRIRDGSVLLINGPISRTGRMSTWLPGRKATAPPRSTAKPPFTRPKIWPSTLLVSVKGRSSRFQLSSRLAFSRLRTTSPPLFSKRSTNTSTLSPTRTSGGCPGEPNSLSGTPPSDLRPTSTMTMSSSSPTTVPRTTLSSRRALELSVSSSMAAKSSRDGRGSMVWVASCIPAPEGVPGQKRGAPPNLAAGARGCVRERYGSGDGRLLGGRKPALDAAARGRERPVRIEFGRVEHPSVASNAQGRDRPVRIAAVTLLQLCQNRGVYRRIAPGPQLLVPAPRPLGVRCGHEQLEAGVGADDGTDIAAGQHRPPAREL